MPKLSMKDRIAERMKRIQIERREKDRNRYSKDYKPEQEGYKPEGQFSK